jgi:hypothetical protein
MTSSNQVIFHGNVVLIKMTNCNEWVTIDAEDYPKVADLRWWKDHLNQNGYAIAKPTRKVCEQMGLPYDRNIYMHRILNNTPDDMVTDHIDRNKLNNVKSNLRTCTQGENALNSTKRKGLTSQYKGVRFIKKYAHAPTPNKWEANITVNGKTRFIGTFPSEMEAALAYDKKAAELHGAFASLNLPHLMQEVI